MTNETRRLHFSEKSATFSSEEEATSLNNVMYKINGQTFAAYLPR